MADHNIPQAASFSSHHTDLISKSYQNVKFLQRQVLIILFNLIHYDYISNIWILKEIKLEIINNVFYLVEYFPISASKYASCIISEFSEFIWIVPWWWGIVWFLLLLGSARKLGISFKATEKCWWSHYYIWMKFSRRFNDQSYFGKKHAFLEC